MKDHKREDKTSSTNAQGLHKALNWQNLPEHNLLIKDRTKVVTVSMGYRISLICINNGLETLYKFQPITYNQFIHKQCTRRQTLYPLPSHSENNQQSPKPQLVTIWNART